MIGMVAVGWGLDDIQPQFNITEGCSGPEPDVAVLGTRFFSRISLAWQAR